MFRIICVLALFGFFASQGCSKKTENPTPEKVSADDVRRDAVQAAQTFSEYSVQTKEDMQRKLQYRLNDMNVKIARLREKGADLKNEAKADWDREMAELKVKQEAAAAKLVEVGNASAEAWEEVQKGAQSAWNDLDFAFREASKKY